MKCLIQVKESVNMWSVLLTFSGHAQFIILELFPKLRITSQGKPCCLFLNWLFIKHGRKVYAVINCVTSSLALTCKTWTFLKWKQWPNLINGISNLKILLSGLLLHHHHHLLSVALTSSIGHPLTAPFTSVS
jgi:hypothetical protein